MRLDFVVDLSETERAMAAVQRRGRALGEAFRTIRPHMRADQKEHAAKQTGPESTWPSRAPSTVERGRASGSGRRRRLARRPLGKLTHAVTYQATRSGVFATSRVPWSNVHQTGGRVGRGSVIPARPFLWVSDRLLTIAVGVVERVLEAAWRGR